MASNIPLLAGLFLLSGAIACALGWVLIQKGPRDAPDGDRKIQTEAIPTSGGIAVFIGTALCSAIYLLLSDAVSSLPVLALACGTLAIFIIGVWDDLVSLPALPKLIAMALISLAVASLGVAMTRFDIGRHVFELGLIVGIAGSALWLVVVTNSVNFMDGSDGLAMGSSLAVAASLSFLALLTKDYTIAALALILAGALLGLLVWNGRGKLFAGDAGALFVGFYLGGLTLLWLSKGGHSVWIGPLLFIGFLADVVMTLIWRAVKRRNLLTAHREHVYQIMLKAGVTHPVVAWIFIWVTLHGALFAGISFMFPPGASTVLFAGYFLLLMIINRRIRRSALEHGHLE